MSSQCTPTVKDLFEADRPRGEFACTYRDWELPFSDGSKLTGCVANYVVVRRIGAAYFELYLNEDNPGRSAGIIASLLDAVLANPQFLLPEAMQKNEIKISENDQDVPIRYNQLPILRTFTIFPSARLDMSVKERLVGRWSEEGLDLIIKDQNYVDAHERKLRPYAFICHDTRDKDTVARPLAERLRTEVGTIWYDEYSLKIGDSLRESIEDGLRRSDRCVMILSKAFLENKGWGRREFDSIYTREIVEKHKVMLPVWVDVTKNELYQYSPILADRFGARWSGGIDEVVKGLVLTLKSPVHSGQSN